MRSHWKLLVLALLAIPLVSVVGCGPSRVSSDVAPDNTGDDNTDEDNSGAVGSTDGD